MKLRTAALLAVVILSNVAGNLVLKLGMDSAPAGAGLIRPLASPVVILGILLLIFWTLMRLRLLGIADLSWVLPVTSLGYVLTAIAGAVFLHETISAARWLGTVLIVAGSSIVGLAGKENPA